MHNEDFANLLGAMPVGYSPDILQNIRETRSDQGLLIISCFGLFSEWRFGRSDEGLKTLGNSHAF